MPVKSHLLCFKPDTFPNTLDTMSYAGLIYNNIFVQLLSPEEIFPFFKKKSLILCLM